MLKKWVIGLVVMFSMAVMAQDGLITQASANDVETTQAKLEAAIAEAGLTLMTVIDHEANALNNGLELRPTRVVLFGNPAVGTPLMQAAQSVAIDLPQKMLIWEAEDGSVNVGFNDPAYLQTRHGIEGQDERLANITGALTNLMNAATAAE